MSLYHELYIYIGRVPFGKHRAGRRVLFSLGADLSRVNQELSRAYNGHGADFSLQNYQHPHVHISLGLVCSG